jgi:hypothetical protein
MMQLLLAHLHQRTSRLSTTARLLRAATLGTTRTVLLGVRSMTLVLDHQTADPARVLILQAANPTRRRLDAPALGTTSANPSAPRVANVIAIPHSISGTLPLHLALHLRSKHAPLTRPGEAAGTTGTTETARLARTLDAASQVETAGTTMLTTDDSGFYA